MLFSRKQRAQRKMKELANLSSVPAFPTSVTKVLEQLRNPDSSMAEIAESVSWDPGLVLRLLKMVNSAAFGLRREVDNCQHAVSFLGRANLESLLLGLAVERILPPGRAPGFDPASYWRISANRAALARLLSERLDPTHQAEAFTIGLLQDLAIPIMAHARPGEYGAILERWQGDPALSLKALEREAFGWDHAELGALIAESWELPESLVEGIRYHHPDADRAVAAAVHLAGLIPVQDSTEPSSLIATARDHYGLTPDWTLDALSRARDQAAELSALMA